MASYEVFEDRENDSASAYDNLKENSKPSQLLQKRAVLGVLQQNTAKFTFRSSNTQVTQEVRVEKVIQDENALSRRLAAARSKAAPTIPVAQFKAFSVYEDDTENTDSCAAYKPPNDLCPDVLKAPENVSTTRTPLAEITESVLESPACSTDTKNSSCMSVDRTLIKTPYKAYPEFRDNCSDAERFYELIEYRQDIYEYLRRTETRHRPKPGYMRKQPDITSSMRTVLVDWLVEVCGEYRMHQESLMLAVNYVDRFLSHMSVVRTKLQLVGTAAMFIASKYEEIYPPDVGEFVYITDDTYNKKQVLRMEHLILKVLKFDLSIPTVGAFLGCYCITWNLTVETRSLAMYLAELSMLEDEPYMKYLPSHLAAGCLALARYTLGHDPWLAHMHRASGYSFADLTECIGHLVRTHHNAAKLPQQAIQEKYRTSKYQHVATIEPRALNLN